MNEDLKAESLLSLMVAIALFAIVLSLVVGTETEAEGFLTQMVGASYELPNSW